MSVTTNELFNFVQGSNVTGESSYDIWKELHPDGTKEEFLENLRAGQLDQVTAKDTYGLVTTEGNTIYSQELIDAVANKVVEQLTINNTLQQNILNNEDAIAANANAIATNTNAIATNTNAIATNANAITELNSNMGFFSKIKTNSTTVQVWDLPVGVYAVPTASVPNIADIPDEIKGVNGVLYVISCRAGNDCFVFLYRYHVLYLGSRYGVTYRWQKITCEEIVD